MSILIKGMEMPKEGSAFAIAIHPDGTITSWTGREMPQYEAVPVPPHGRLIDADALVTKRHGNNSQRTMWWNIEMLLNAAPTIIPADKEEQT